MAKSRGILATNIKEYRRRLGYSQDKLAELTGISSQYLATIETCRKFPTPEVLDKISDALGIGIPELFAASPPPPSLSQTEMEKLKQILVSEVVKTIKQSFAEEHKKKK